MKKIKGYKALNKDMTCKGFKYAVGKTYKTDNIGMCQSGFHFCENPLDVLEYYDLCESQFCDVESLGKTLKHGEDSKVCTSEIKINAQIGLSGFISASVDFLLKKCKKKSGYYSQLASSGDSSKLASSGYYSKLAINGQDSVGANVGVNGIIKGAKGCWITLAEYNGVRPVCVKSAKIDGKIIKEDTWYKLKNKNFEEV